MINEFLKRNNIILKKDKRAPVVTSHIWYKIGSADEVSGKTGLSHALEHMMFKGTKKNPRGKFSEIISISNGKHPLFTFTVNLPKSLV